VKTKFHLLVWRTFRSISRVVLILLALAGGGQAQILDTWGNSFIYGGSTQAPTLSSTSRFDGRFTAQSDITADQVVFRTQTIVGNPSMRVEIYGDNGGGLPGALLGQTGTINLSSADNTSGIQANLLSNVELVAGSVYHVVYVPVSVDASNTITIPIVGGSNITWSPQTGNLDPAQNRLFSTNSGGSWTVGNSNQSNASMLSFALRNSISSAVAGQVVNASYSTSLAGIGSTTQQGQHFVYEGPGGYEAQEITLRLASGGGTGLGELRLSLFDSNNQLLLDQLLLADASDLTGSFANYTFALDSAVLLTNGDSYQMVLHSSDSTGDSYRTYVQRTLFGGYNEGTFQGTDAFALYSTNSGTDFSERLDGDMYFELGIDPVPEPSSFALIAFAFLGRLMLARGKRRTA